MQYHSVSTSPAYHLTDLQTAISPLIAELSAHPVYTKLNSMEDIRIFMQYHAFAVWDFMSLVKALQRHYAPPSVPWYPSAYNEVTRFINEIVLGEESDVDLHGNYRSHYEMYLEAMTEIGADTRPILTFVEHAKTAHQTLECIANEPLPQALKDFLNFTFQTIETQEIHRIAAAFTFGREDIIPQMFLQVLQNSGKRTAAPKFNYYLERHIELDGDHHGPMALKLMEVACGTDPQKWKEAAETAQQAIRNRMLLWTMVDQALTRPIAS